MAKIEANLQLLIEQLKMAGIQLQELLDEYNEPGKIKGNIYKSRLTYLTSYIRHKAKRIEQYGEQVLQDYHVQGDDGYNYRITVDDREFPTAESVLGLLEVKYANKIKFISAIKMGDKYTTHSIGLT